MGYSFSQTCKQLSRNITFFGKRAKPEYSVHVNMVSLCFEALTLNIFHVSSNNVNFILQSEVTDSQVTFSDTNYT